MDKLELRIRLGFLILQMAGLVLITWVLWDIVSSGYSTQWGVVAVVGFLSLVGISAVWGYKQQEVDNA